MTDPITRYLGAALMLAPAVALIWLGYRFPAPQRPVKRAESGPITQAVGEVVAGVVGLAVALVGLVAASVCLALVLAPAALLLKWILS